MLKMQMSNFDKLLWMTFNFPGNRCNVRGYSVNEEAIGHAKSEFV